MNIEQAFLESFATAPAEAAQSHLAAGRPIYYSDPAYPDEIIKEYPGGKKEIVSVSLDGEIKTVREV